jgi:hypothetical protein
MIQLLFPTGCECDVFEKGKCGFYGCWWSVSSFTQHPVAESSQDERKKRVGAKTLTFVLERLGLQVAAVTRCDRLLQEILARSRAVVVSTYRQNYLSAS